MGGYYFFFPPSNCSNCFCASALVIVGKAFHVSTAGTSTTGVCVHETESAHEFVSAVPFVERYITEVNAEANKKIARIMIMRNFKTFLCVVI